MAPIRDAILYNFKSLSKKEWLKLTEILSLNGIKIQDSSSLHPSSIFSSNQVYDYVASSPKHGSPVMRFLEEAELELKCLAFIDFDFINPHGDNHCKNLSLPIGQGLTLPPK
jgi:hypothetical protein